MLLVRRIHGLSLALANGSVRGLAALVRQIWRTITG